MTIRWVTAFLDLPAASYDEAVRFWSTATGTSASSRRGEHDEFVTLLPQHGDAWLRVQRVDDGPGGVHLDLHVEDVTPFAWRAVSLGATEVMREDGLVVLRSPGGLPFCVVDWGGETTRADPQPGVVDQVCLDIPPAHLEGEVAFWSDLTGWELRHGAATEFFVLRRPAGQPIRLLLQRLDDDPGTGVTAHLDLAAGDERDEVAQRHVALGARLLRERRSWLTLRDPAGHEYCVTGRDPTTGLLAQ